VFFTLFLLVAGLCVAASFESTGRAAYRIFYRVWQTSQAGTVLGPGARGDVSWALQKAVHVGLFGCLGVLGRAGSRSPRQRYAMVIGGLAVCVLSEVLQLGLPSRHAGLADAVLNGASFLGAFTVTGWVVRG
jgi:VanZ family protein